MRITYGNTAGFEAVDQLTLIDQVGVSRSRLVQLRLTFTLQILLGRPVFESAVDAVGRGGVGSGLTLLLTRAADVLEIRWVARLDDIVRGQDCAWSDQSKLFTQLQIGRVCRFVVVEEHQIDMFDSTAIVQSLDAHVTGPDDDFDNVTEAGQVNQ